MLTSRNVSARSVAAAAGPGRVSRSHVCYVSRGCSGNALAHLKDATRQHPVSTASDRQRVLAAAAGEGAAASTAVATASTDTAAGLLEVTKDTWQQEVVDASANTMIVVDFFTDWCGPCKMIYPELVKLSAEIEPAAKIVKFNCNQYNKERAKACGIKVAPTFHVYKGGEKVADMTGAKVDKLRGLIQEQLGQN